MMVRPFVYRRKERVKFALLIYINVDVIIFSNPLEKEMILLVVGNKIN